MGGTIPPTLVRLSEFPPPSSAPAGWYPDPTGAGVRYFDGVQWAPPSPRFEQLDEHPSLPLSAAIGALVVLVVSLLAAKLIVDPLISLDWPLPAYVAIVALVGYGPSLVWGWYVQRRWGKGQLSSLGWRFRWSDLGWGPLTWISAIGIQIAIAAVIIALDIPLSSNVDDVSELDVDRSYVIATLVAAVIAAPVIEELVFRGLVLRGFLSRMGATWAILLQGVLFGAAHVDPVRGTGNIGLVMILSGVGVAFGGAAYFTHRLGAPIIAHAIFNGVVLAIVLSGVANGLEPDDAMLRDHTIVDEAYASEPRGNEHDDVAFDTVDVVERGGVDDLDVFDVAPGFSREHR